jgi:23S rRNA (pseudouridine1915-N3)-methyltransferase
VPAHHTLVALDERGQTLSSMAMAKQLSEWHDHSQSLCLIIGSADGLDPELLASCHARWRLSDLTLPHALAQVLAIEALYRAWSILAGHPYHRE